MGRALLVVLIASFSLAAGNRDARAVGEGDKLETAKHAVTIKPSSGFIDSPLSVSADGSQLVYVESDAAGRSTAKIVALGDFKVLAEIDLSRIKGAPIAIDLIGSDLFVVTRLANASELGALVSGGKIRRKFGPATHVRKAQAGAHSVASIYRRSSKRSITTHTIEARDLQTGRRHGKRTVLRVDGAGRDRSKKFVLHYFLNDYLAAVGTLEGSYDRKADQRMPDQHGVLDVVTGKISGAVVGDLIAHRKQRAILEKHPNENRFFEFPIDRTSLRVFEDGVARTVSLAEKAAHYDPKSLVAWQGPADILYFSLRIDPVHAAAAAARRAVIDWIDLYELRPGQAKASRRARLLPESREAFTWIAGPRHWVLLPSHVGFSRGGPRLEIVELATRRP